MEIVVDVKIETKMPSYINVITDFGYFKKITGESNQNISYIRNATRAEFSMKPSSSGLNKGLTITLKHSTLQGVENAKRLLLSLIDTMKDDFEVYKGEHGVPADGVKVVVELNLASCGECGFMSTSFPEFEEHVSKHHRTAKEDPQKPPWGASAAKAMSGESSKFPAKFAATGERKGGFGATTRSSSGGFGPTTRSSSGFGATTRGSGSFGAASRSPASNFTAASRTGSGFGASRSSFETTPRNVGAGGPVRSSTSFSATSGSGGPYGAATRSSGFGSNTRSSGISGAATRSSGFTSPPKSSTVGVAAATRSSFGATRSGSGVGATTGAGFGAAARTSRGFGATTRSSSSYSVPARFDTTRNVAVRPAPSTTSPWNKTASQSFSSARPATRSTTTSRPVSKYAPTRSVATLTGTAVTRRPLSGLAAKRATLGFAASKYARAMGRPGMGARMAASGPAAASRFAPGAAATAGRPMTRAASARQPAAQSAGLGLRTTVKRGADSTDFTASKRQKVTTAGARKSEAALSREENLLARRLRNNLSDEEAKVVVQQLKNKLTAREVKIVFQQIEETEKRERLATRSDYITLQLKVLVGVLRRKGEGVPVSSVGKLQTVSSVRAETNRIMEMFNKKQISEKVLQDVMNKYANEYKFTAAEKRVLQSSGGYGGIQKSATQFRNFQKVLVEKVGACGSVYCGFDALKFVNSQKQSTATPGRTSQVGVTDRSPPDAERMVAVRVALDALLRRRIADVLNDNAAEAMGKKLLESVGAGPQTESTLRQSWESLIKRKQFQDRREPSRGDKITIRLRTIVNYIKEQVATRHIGNRALSAVLDVLKPGSAQPTDSDVPSKNVPIFPVLEKPHATERGVQTRLQWLIAEIDFILKKRKAGQLPDQEVEMMLARIKNGVPAIYWDVVYGRFQETARDVERMAGRQMSPSRSLTCKLQVICTYARHYLLDKLPGGSPLDPAQHRNPFQYIDYNMDARSQQQSGAGRAGQGPKPRLSMPGGLSPKPLMGMAAGARSRRLSDIESLIGVMDKEAAQEQKRLILELREYAKEANIGKASMSIRRVEKVERDLLNKLPNQYTDALREAKEKVEDGKGRLLTARERLETTIRWILGNVHAGPDRNKTADSGAAAVKTSAHVPPIIRMKGAEPLQREMLALWKKLKTSKPNATEVNDKLNKLRIKLTRPEADTVKRDYNRQIMNLSKKYNVSRLADPVAAVAKFEVVLKYILGDESQMSGQSIVPDVARKFYEVQDGATASPVKPHQQKTTPQKETDKQNGTSTSSKKQAEADDDVVVVDDAPEAKKQRRDVRLTVLRNKFNVLGRDFKNNKMDTDKMAELIALMKMNLFLSCDDEDELFTEVRAAWEARGGDDLDEQNKLQIEFELTSKRILAKVETLIGSKTPGVTIKDVKERLSCVMTGKMVELEIVDSI